MNLHKLARLTPLGRARMVRRLEAGQSVARVARELDLSTTTVRGWWQRFQTEGPAGLADRSSRPHRSPRATPRYRRRQIVRLRHQRRSSLEIAAALGLPLATVVQVQRRLGLGRLAVLDPKPPVHRYERRVPGALIHSAFRPCADSSGSGTSGPEPIAPRPMGRRSASSGPAWRGGPTRRPLAPPGSARCGSPGACGITIGSAPTRRSASGPQRSAWRSVSEQRLHQLQLALGKKGGSRRRTAWPRLREPGAAELRSFRGLDAGRVKRVASPAPG